MWNIGDIKQGSDIGKSRLNLYVWIACEKCGIPRWTQYLRRLGGPKKKHCKTCALNLRKGEKRGIAHNRLNLVGKKFNRLTVLNDDGTNTHGELQWKCLCDCGKIVFVPGNRLTSGGTKSCGCYHKDRTRQLFSKPPQVIRVNRIFLDYSRRAKEKNLDFVLTKEQFKSLMDSDCYYCGAKPSNSFVQHNRPLPVYQGIDRMDNTEGYTPDNVVPCCIVCNKMKKALSHDEFLLHIHRISSRFEVESPQADCYSEVCGGLVL